MKSLDNIRKKIGVIDTTNKITEAMKLVANAKIQKQKQVFAKTSSFMNTLYDLLIKLMIRSSKKDFAKVNKSNKSLYIIVSSSLGLCGGYNIAVCKYLISLLHEQDEIIVIGNKGYSYLKSRGYKQQISNVYNYDNNINHIELLPISQKIINGYEKNIYKDINIIYTKYINSVKFEPTLFRLLPLDENLFKANENMEEIELNNKKQIIEFESNRKTIINNFLPFFTSAVIISACAESKLCEYSSRRDAMSNASDNAKELISQLKLEYNQIRQERITQEINEIIAGSEK